MLAELPARRLAPWQWLTIGLIGSAWAVTLVLLATGGDRALHHHALIEGGVPLAVAIPVFLVAWQVMVAAMMLPASVPALRAAIPKAAAGWGVQGSVIGGFLVAYGVVWGLYGLAAFFGDVVLHQVAEATPWLEARPWIIQGGVFALAGAYQLTPMKRWSLAACQHPLAHAGGSDVGVGVRLGLRHAFECLVCSWALMLLMFAVGVAHAPWMAALTVIMAGETLAPNGQRIAPVVGLVLLGLAVATVLVGGVGLALPSPHHH
jgi:predicted metal-binding membrane protein